MKAKNQNKDCEAVSSNCVSWEGEEIPCLGICIGDSLSEVESAIANKLCKVLDDLDLSKLDISCVVEKADALQDRSLFAILQLLYDNQCTLKQLINSSNGTTTDTTINVNLRCLKKFDDFGNEIPQDLNQSLQSIINKVCTQDTDITGLKSRVTDLENIVDNLPTTTTPTEVSLTTCVNPGLRPTSQVVSLLASAHCALEAATGDPSEINGAISQQPPNLNLLYQTNAGWNLSVTNAAESLANMWIIVGDLLSRVKLIEDNCCAITCDDVKVGFEVLPNDLQNGISVKFSSKSGTSIPEGFTDCGSTITITDESGNSLNYDLVITNGGTQGEFDLSGLDLTTNIVIEINAKLCATGLTCDKCISRIYKLDGGLCPFCEVVVTGDEGSSVSLVYTESGSTITKFLTINAGETGIIKTTAKVQSLLIDGNADVDIDCIVLPEPENLECYQITWAIEFNTGADTGPWNVNDVHIQGFGVLDKLYSFDMRGDGYNVTPPVGISELFTYIQTNVPSSLIKLVSHTYGIVGERHELVLAFKTAPSVAAKTYLKFGGHYSIENTYAYAHTCADCCDSEAES